MGIVIAPKKNFEWKLDEQVKNGYSALLKSSDNDLIEYMNSLNDELLENLYIWRLGFNIPESRNKMMDNILSHFKRFKKW
jgi:succinate dehydrogenase flavin-adding protein (antitoxin of CptAB toxin-antitoxin module)